MYINVVLYLLLIYTELLHPNKYKKPSNDLKSLHLNRIFCMLQDFVHARQLFSACLEVVTEFSPKLRQVMLNEMLLLDIRAHEAGAADGNMERPPPDLVSRVRGYLEMRIHGMC